MATRTQTTKARTDYSPYKQKTQQATCEEDDSGWILRTQAMKEFHLAATDLDSILPISIEKNPRGPYDIKRYNRSDVAALAKRLKSGAAAVRHITTKAFGTELPKLDAGALAPAIGEQIVRTRARDEYGLKPQQLDRLTPTSIKENPHGAHKPSMRIYNLIDVQRLAAGVRSASASPSKPKQAGRYY
ncbi:hypothetical protein C8J56DRAFT_288366 [Mycena floridula]|nr:hypothetical protein C8J56DRAFT_288366 [Mycena floridula]